MYTIAKIRDMFSHFDSRQIQAITKVAATFSSPNSVRHAIRKCSVSSYTRQISGDYYVKISFVYQQCDRYKIISKNKFEKQQQPNQLMIAVI